MEIKSEYTSQGQADARCTIAQNVSELLINIENVRKIEVYYRWLLINEDPDDNKFVDCAVAGNVKFVVSNDKHFKILKEIEFPSIEVITADQFLEELNES